MSTQIAMRKAQLEKERAETQLALAKARAMRTPDELDLLVDVVPLRWDRVTKLDRVLGWFGLCRLKRLAAARRAVDILMSTQIHL